MKPQRRRFLPVPLFASHAAAWWVALSDSISLRRLAADQLWSLFRALGIEHFGILDLARDIPQAWLMMFVLALAGSSASWLLGGAVRMLAESRFHATGVDSLERVRAWASRHARLVRALSFLPATITVLLPFLERLTDHYTFDGESQWPWVFGMLAACVVPFAATTWAVRATVRQLFAPVEPAEKEEQNVADEDFYFSAVAVTPETRAAVLAVTALSAAAILLAFTTMPLVGLAALLAPAVLGTLAFHRASRIALGLDGALVTGTSRTRFFPYAEIDSAGVSKSGEVLLKRGTKVILRLQLHGADARRRDAIVGRIEKGIERARIAMGGGANRLAEAASKGALGHAAVGHSNYRAPSATRDELWELLEAAATVPNARIAAAEALKKGCDESERARLRVAAEHCAEPTARKALLRIAVFDDEPEDEAPAADAQRRANTGPTTPPR